MNREERLAAGRRNRAAYVERERKKPNLLPAAPLTFAWKPLPTPPRASSSSSAAACVSSPACASVAALPAAANFATSAACVSSPACTSSAVCAFSAACASSAAAPSPVADFASAAVPVLAVVPVGEDDNKVMDRVEEQEVEAMEMEDEARPAPAHAFALAASADRASAARALITLAAAALPTLALASALASGDSASEGVDDRDDVEDDVEEEVGPRAVVPEDEDEDDEESNIEGTMMEVLHLDAAVITPMDTLHTHGCVIIPGALDLPDQLIEAIKEVNYNKAGLPQAPDTLLGYDPRRMQSLCSRRTVPWIASISKLVSAHLSMYGLTTTSSKEAKELKHVHALKSLANVAYDESETSPQDGDQSKHMDESPEYVATFMQQPGMTDADMPLSILVALDARVRLRVWPRRGISPLMILLDPGEVLVFRGDTCHAGLGYSIENVRVHMYLYHPAYRPPPSSIYACPPG